MLNLDEIYIGYVNLDSRPDRLAHIQHELARIGLEGNRHRGRTPDEFDREDAKLQVQWNRTPGSIGCWFSQMGVMISALAREKHAMVLEDDVVLCSDFKKRLDYMDKYLGNEDWDVLWLGGTVHVNPPHWHIGGKNPDLPNTKLTKDAICTDYPNVLKTYGAFSTHAYIVNNKSITRVVDLLHSVMHEAMGIDWAFIRLGDQLNCYMFVPGMAKQYNNMSNIGSGMTMFENFSRLNGTIENSAYWWQDKAEDFDPQTFDWGEAKNIL